MADERREQILHEAFEIGLGLKALVALSELLAGLALYLVPNDRIVALASWLTAHEIAEDPADRVANLVMRGATAFSIGSQDFFAFYLASHGLVKLAVLGALARGFGWAYPLAMAVMGWFILYQLYRLTLGFSGMLVALTLFDLVVLALIWHEYRRAVRP